VEELEPVDLVVCGTVAVNRDGVRVGKGGGYSDLEFGLLVEARLVGDATTIGDHRPPAPAARRGAARDRARLPRRPRRHA
jgi:5-formyltetrahydrofolate cyclo-ligase family